jgi:hypothetical protein
MRPTLTARQWCAVDPPSAAQRCALIGLRLFAIASSSVRLMFFPAVVTATFGYSSHCRRSVGVTMNEMSPGPENGAFSLGPITP